MARPLRIEFKGALYHILSRGNERRDFFLGNDNYEVFLDVLEEMSERFEVDIFAYVLMNNHYHLLIRTNQDNLSKSMQWAGRQSVIPFPVGWSLRTKLVPAGGYTLQPTHVYNDGKGSYTLSVMTVAKKGACPWKKGEYHYLLEINLNQYKGRSIGQIVIK